MKSIATVLTETTPFNTLSPELRERLAAGSVRRTYRRHEAVMGWESPANQHIYLILSGRVEMVLGQEQDSIAVRGPGELVGLSSALGDGNIVGAVRALDDSELLLIPTALLFECLRVPDFAANFGQLLAAQLREAYRHMSAPDRISGLERQPLRGLVATVMSVPPVTCDPEVTADEASRLMAQNRVTSVIVLAAEQPVGIVTQRDLICGVMVANRLPQSVRVREIMSAPLHTADPDEPLYRALLTMIRERIKHLAVVSDGRLVGVATLSDVSRARGSGALAVVAAIEHAPTFADLARTREQADRVVLALVSEGATPMEALPVITEFNDRLTRRILTLTEAELEQAGLGAPPCEYAWLTMGSAGRGEQFFRTDQDNAIVYADPAPDQAERVASYFERLSQVAVEALVTCGWARCKGDAMATNPVWRRSISEWEAALDTRFDRIGPEDVLNACIFFDFRPVHGNFGLAARLRSFALKQAAAHPTILRVMAESDLEAAVPVGPFGVVLTPQWGRRRGHINLKGQATVHVVDCVRLFALRAGIAEVSTITRLHRLAERGDLSQDDAEWIAAAYETVLNLRFRLALAVVHQGGKPSDDIRITDLPVADQTALKQALVAVSRLQTLTGHSFRLLFV